jgi:cytochrome oxidase assembly protein ShyY1
MYNLDNITLLCLVLISGIIPGLLAYEKKSLSKDKQPSLRYYIQWFVLSFTVIIFAVSTSFEKNKVENNIIVGTPDF